MKVLITYPEQQEVNNFVRFNPVRLGLVNSFTQCINQWGYEVPGSEFTMRAPWEKRIKSYFSSNFYKSLKLIERVHANMYVQEEYSTVTIELIGAMGVLTYILKKDKPA